MSEPKKIRTSELAPIIFMGSLFVIIQGSALFVVGPFQAAGLSAFDNPSDPANLVYFFSTFLIATAVILLIAKFRKKLVNVLILGSVGFFAFFVLLSLSALVIPDIWVALGISGATAALMIVLLVKYPEWYVIDACGALFGLGSIAMLGISLSIPLVIILLTGLAIYDAISVYKTKHMIDLADVALERKLPVMLVIPKSRGYSLIRETKGLKEKLRDKEEREAFGIGLGDVVMPGILVASTFYNIPSNGILVALSVMIGTLCGFAALMTFVIKGRPQAGLPFLCSGAIVGYLLSSYLLFGRLVGLSPFI
jgi:presenilin-like A22 family membrane protease